MNANKNLNKNRIAKVNVENAKKRRIEALNNAIEHVNKIESIHISVGNSKMGPIPSYSVLPLITCTNCGECSRYCYAAKNMFNMPKNIEALAENTAMNMYRMEEVEKQLNRFLNGSTILYRYFRFNVAGDMNRSYLEIAVRIAKKNPWTKFLVFTKNFKMFNEWLSENEKPENMSIVFSVWDNTKIDNPHNMPVAIVKVNEDTEIPESAFHCSGDCANCLNCWNAECGTARYFDLH